MEEIVDVRELVGVSLNARTANADSLPDRQVTLGAFGLANDLGRMLWRMKYGQDVKHAGLNRAALLLAGRLRKFSEFDRAGKGGYRRTHRGCVHHTGANHGDVVERLSYVVISEWIRDRCSNCGGRGSIGGKELTPASRAVACSSCCGGGRLMASRRLSTACDDCFGTGRQGRRSISLQRELCPVCQGSGKQHINHRARAAALAISLDQYHRHWQARFEFAHSTLDLFDERTTEQVNRQLRR